MSSSYSFSKSTYCTVAIILIGEVSDALGRQRKGQLALLGWIERVFQRSTWLNCGERMSGDLSQVKPGWEFGGSFCKGGKVRRTLVQSGSGHNVPCLELRLECIRENKKGFQKQTGTRLFLVNHHQASVRKC